MSRLLPPATRAIILLNVAVYLLEISGTSVIAEHYFALWPLGSGLFRPWQLISYAFLHDPHNIAHIFFNMFALFMFGGALESYWGGARRFTMFYLICVLAAALTQLTVDALARDAGPVVGASGGVFGLLLAFAWYFPRQRILLIFPPIPMPAWLFVTLYGVLELFLGITGRNQAVAHFAHLGGMLGAALCIAYWRARRRFRS
jgi:membrane associated rhomboid family serine protease